MLYYQQKTFKPNDLNLFNLRLRLVCEKRLFRRMSIGCVDDCYIPIVVVNPLTNSGPHLLIAAGFHGEEQAGPWAALRYMETFNDELRDRVNLTFLPLVNPTGFRNTCRYNYNGDSPNTGFTHSFPDEKLSEEGSYLKVILDKLRKAASSGFLTLHEQTHSKCFYLYVFERGSVPSKFAEILRNAGAEFFPLLANQKIPPPGEGYCRNGIVKNVHDGTFEDLLYCEGVPHTFCSETPINAPIVKRIEANIALIERFVQESL